MIDELKENTFYAKIVLEVSSLTNEIDARPSDAIALAVRTTAPIYVSEEVMKSAAFVPSSEDELSEEMPGQESESKKKTIETKTASLQDQLREAIEKEDYERAAKLRDEINNRKGSNN